MDANKITYERPKEMAFPCPNCGDIHWASELTHSAVKRIDCPPHGSIVSTLYGVCSKCSEIHKK